MERPNIEAYIKGDPSCTTGQEIAAYALEVEAHADVFANAHDGVKSDLESCRAELLAVKAERDELLHKNVQKTLMLGVLEAVRKERDALAEFKQAVMAKADRYGHQYGCSKLADKDCDCVLAIPGVLI